MINGGYYHMDGGGGGAGAAAASGVGTRSYYGYQNQPVQQQHPPPPHQRHPQGRGSYCGGGMQNNMANMQNINGGWGRGAGGAAASPGMMNRGRGGLPLSGAYTNQRTAPQPRASPARGQPPQSGMPGKFTGMNSFSMQHNIMKNHNVAGRIPSMGSFSGAFGSFRSNPDNLNLQRANSGMQFGTAYGSFMQGRGGGAGGISNTSLLNFGGSSNASNRSIGSAGGYDYNGGGGGAGRPLQRQGSLPSYSFGSFANGLPGMGPGTASTNSMTSQNTGMVDYGASNTSDHHDNTNNANSYTADMYNLQRQDSQNALQRQFSIAGQFYNHGGNMGGGGGWGNNVHTIHSSNGFGGVKPGMILNNRMGGIGITNRMMGPASAEQQQMMMQQMQQQRRLASGKGGEDVVTEGQPTALGRKNSVSNMLERKDSQKRVGMYFTNKAASQDDVEYKKDGDPGTTKTASSKSRDPSLVNNVKPILLLDNTEGGATASDLEIDGDTVRAVKEGNDEIQKYDMREIIFVDTKEDQEVSGSSLEEIRSQFVTGFNVAMLMADAECKAADPTQWFTWNALKTVIKNSFARIDENKAAASRGSFTPTYEITASVVVLQDDQMLDLLGDDSNFARDDYRHETLVVAESPLFGNVANNAVFVVLESADEFNDTLDACLERATGFFQHESQTDDNNKNLDDVEEYGIVLVTCVLRQTRKSSSTGKVDIMVSSIFASGVGNGIIHYNRIMDKNPAEPRALFYSTLHRSCHSTAVFSLKQNNPDVFHSLQTLQRFSKVQLRNPKIGSVRQFLAYSDSVIPKCQAELKGMKEGKQKLQMQRFMERLELMTQDMDLMLDDPENSVPKTYI